MSTEYQYGGGTNERQQSLHMHRNYAPPAPLPPQQDNESSSDLNGIQKPTSKRRRESAKGPSAGIPTESFIQPPTPEVPKAPPISYRSSYNIDNNAPPRTGYPTPSFAERAQALTGRSIPSQSSEPLTEPVQQPAKPGRRGSLNRPIGGLYSEIQQHKRDSYPSPNGLASPRRFSNPMSPQENQALETHPASQEPESTAYQKLSGSYSSDPKISQPSTRRVSAVSTQTSNKGWAPDRSPLQKLEVKLSDISKEEKRARVQEAEQRLRESQENNRHSKPDSQHNHGVHQSSSRRVSADVEHPRSRGSRSHPEQISVARQMPVKSDITKDSSPINTGALTSDHRPRSDKMTGSLPAEQYSQDPAAKRTVQSEQPVNRHSSRRGSRRTDELSRMEAQPERGVRFQGADGIEDPDVSPSVTHGWETRNGGRNSGIEALARSDEAHNVQRNKPRSEPRSTTVKSGSREVPKPKQHLYHSKVATSQADASAATFGGIADPVAKQAVHRNDQGPRYESPPQTAAGIRTRQAVGFGSGGQHIIDPPAYRKHHLSGILHRDRGQDGITLGLSSSQPRQLDEWKRAGTARLTNADFITDKGADAEEESSAWWEGGRSGSRSKVTKANRQDAQSLQGGYQSGTGKSKIPFLYHRTPRTGQRTEAIQGHETRTRPYVGDQAHEGLKSASRPPLENPLAHLLHRSGHDQTRGLSSAYSYSCPDLALHDPSHENHICKPYLSSELTQSMRSIRVRPAPELATFNPPLYLKCGPLLRYTGLKRERHPTKTRGGVPSSIERETWRGSVMIVTADADSSYGPVPTLRLFHEAMEVLPPASQRLGEEDGQNLPSEYVDPVAGLPKLSRSGKTVYVKPVDDLEHGKDLSRLENDEGLFEETRTAAVPTAYGTPDFRASSANPKPVKRESRTAKKGQQVKGIRLHAERGVTFWRFNLEVELGSEQTRVAYSINNSPSIGFWIPARGQSMNVMFHSCNGFSMSVNPDEFAGPDPLWRDVLNNHQTRPFHVMIGGGDQIYNDAVMSQSPLFRDWLEIKNPHHKQQAEFTPLLREQLETFYLERYSMWFSQGLFGMANSQIPMINMWDDHDIIDGFGSYPHHFMSTPVFCGLGAVAFKYYMLFQHQTVSNEGSADEPSWLMGAAPGPYINELSRSIFVSLGKNIALLAVDCRTERMREEVLSEASYDLLFDRCRREILEGETKHLVVLLGIPIAYPRLVWLENLLTSRVMDPVKALGRAGMLGGFLNKFDGGVEILDDLDDHWTSKNHKRERNWFVQELQELAAEKSVRITILGGDVHLAACGQFYSNPKLRIPKDKDHRYMANVISSAIVNTPPPNNMADILNRRNKTHHLDQDTEEDMIPMFTHDVNGNPRNNKCLLPRRNWCSIREYHPGSTPPPTPPLSESETNSDDSPPPPTRLQRTLSLNRDDVRPGNLLRRLSGRGPPPSDDYLTRNRYDLRDQTPPDSPENDGYFPRQPSLPQRAATVNVHSGHRHSSAPLPDSSAPLPRPGFHRRPTNMSENAAARGDLDDLSSHINLEHGLDIVINCEVNQKDPAGVTVPYRLLIPALFYQGEGDENIAPFRKKGLVSRLTSLRGRRRNSLARGQGQGNYGQEASRTPSKSEGEGDVSQSRPRRWSFGVTQRRQYRDQTPPYGEEDLVKREREREIGEEGTQKGRQFEHRSQQIGQKAPQPFTMPPRQQKQHSDLETPIEGQPSQRLESVDYHSHLDSSPPLGPAGTAGPKPSKVGRMLGVANLQRNPSTGGVSKLQRSSSMGARKATFPAVRRNSEGPANQPYDDDDSESESEEYYEDDDQPRDEQRVSQGYSGIEAYREKKGWRKWVDKARDWEEKSRGSHPT